MTSAAAFCANCGNALEPHHHFCTRCGAAVAPPPAREAPHEVSVVATSGTVLSPDGKQYWDGHNWLEVTLSSPDGKYVWSEAGWLPVTTGVMAQDVAGQAGKVPATVAAWCTCLGAALLLILAGNRLGEGMKLVVEAIATLPILLIHYVDDTFRHRRFRAPSLPHLFHNLANVSAMPWWTMALVYGAALAIIYNLGGIILTTLGGVAGLAFLPFGPLLTGAFLAHRSEGHARLGAFTLGYTLAFINIIFALATVGAPRDTSPPLLVAFGVPIAGTGLGLLSLLGHEIERFRLSRKKRVRAPAPAPQVEGPSIAVLTPDQAGYWDGEGWAPVYAISEDGAYAWNGTAWLRIAASLTEATEP